MVDAAIEVVVAEEREEAWVGVEPARILDEPEVPRVCTMRCTCPPCPFGMG